MFVKQIFNTKKDFLEIFTCIKATRMANSLAWKYLGEYLFCQKPENFTQVQHF